MMVVGRRNKKRKSSNPNPEYMGNGTGDGASEMESEMSTQYWLVGKTFEPYEYASR